MPSVCVHLDPACPARVRDAVAEAIDALGAERRDEPEDAQLWIVSSDGLDAWVAPLAERPRPTRPLIWALDAERCPGALARCLDAGADDYVALDDGAAHLKERLTVLLARAERRLEVSVEVALEGLERVFEDLAHHLGEILHVTDATQTRQLYVSPAVERITGLGREQIRREPVSYLSIVHPDDRAALHAAAERGIREGASHEVEYRILRPDGEERWLRLRSFPVHDSRGRLTRWVGVTSDETARKRAERALEARRALLAGATEALTRLLSAPDIHAVLDEVFAALGSAADVDRVYMVEHEGEGRVPRQVRLTHLWQRDEALPERLAEFTRARPVSDLNRPYFERIANGDTLTFTLDDLPGPIRAIAEATATRSLLIVPLMHEARCLGHIGFVDCTENRAWHPHTRSTLEATAAAIGEVFVRDAAHRALRRQASRLQALFEATDPTLEPDAQLEALLDTAARSFGMDRAVLTRLEAGSSEAGSPPTGTVFAAAPIGEPFVPGRAAPLSEDDVRAIRREQTEIVDDGGEREVGARWTVPLWVDGRPWGTLALTSAAPRSERTTHAERRALQLLGRFVALLLQRRAADAERGELERRLRDTQRLESLGVLAGGIAHDFNNLLMAILGNAELTLLDLSEGSPAREHVEQITQASRRASELTQQILAYAGRARIEAHPLRFGDLVSGMTELLAAVLPKNARFALSEAPDVPPVRADAGQVRQVVLNLLTNAAESLDGAPGTLAVRIDVESHATPPEGRFAPGAASPGRYVVLEVSDTGRGIPEEAQTRVFEPFYTTKEMGRGLGLSVVAGIVRAHGGVLQLRSEPGAGSTFRLLWPAAEEAITAPGASTPEAEPRALAGRRILVVDDTAAVRETVAKVLEHAGAEPAMAADGEEALERLAGEPGFDAAVVDLTMPGRGGREVLEAIRANDPRFPVLLMSGYAQSDGGLLDDVAARFVQKPFRPQALVGALAALLARGD
ncbi:MAG TPA: ATP-binding protein [Sandaracinaceae bacterium LLY-WYZ-13_1]|nr:ATP-binding protein [Sandaracinaceae bacterium LLY-WYZ-13_1]